jgi:hypothetical protein
VEINTSKYHIDIQRAVKCFWETRKNQQQKQIEGRVIDQGNRGAVTGGQQMNGFLE